MPLLPIRRLVVALLIGAVVLHLAWSSAMAIAWSSTYSHRIIDIRRWPELVSVERVTEMVSMFLSRAVQEPALPATLFVGSSVVYGFPWQEEVGVSARYAVLRPSERVVNVAVIGADLAFLENAVLCGASNARVHAGIVIVEFPIINSVNNLAGRTSGQEVSPPCNETVGQVGYWSFAMRHPLGAGWLPFIWDNMAYPQSDATVKPGQVYAGYFTELDGFRKIAPRFEGQIVKLLERAKTIGRQVYAFPSPVFVPGLRDIGATPASVQAQLAAALNACRSVPGVRCLDPESFYSRREFYMNLTHFNQRGHLAFAEWLITQVDQPAAPY